MALQRPLARPPIREAIVEVKSEPVEMRRVNDLRDRLAPAFPNAKPFRLASVAMNLPDERRGAGSDPGDPHQTGWRCESVGCRRTSRSTRCPKRCSSRGSTETFRSDRADPLANQRPNGVDIVCHRPRAPIAERR